MKRGLIYYVNREQKEERKWKEAKTPLLVEKENKFLAKYIPKYTLDEVKTFTCEGCQPLQPIRDPTFEEKKFLTENTLPNIPEVKTFTCEGCKPLQPIRDSTFEEKLNMYLEAENWDKLSEVFNDPTVDWSKVNIKPYVPLTLGPIIVGSRLTIC